MSGRAQVHATHLRLHPPKRPAGARESFGKASGADRAASVVVAAAPAPPAAPRPRPRRGRDRSRRRRRPSRSCRRRRSARRWGRRCGSASRSGAACACAWGAASRCGSARAVGVGDGVAVVAGARPLPRGQRLGGEPDALARQRARGGRQRGRDEQPGDGGDGDREVAAPAGHADLRATSRGLRAVAIGSFGVVPSASGSRIVAVAPPAAPLARVTVPCQRDGELAGDREPEPGARGAARRGRRCRGGSGRRSSPPRPAPGPGPGRRPRAGPARRPA